MDKASEQARQGNLDYFEHLSPEELGRLISRCDEDGRTLLHAASTSGSIELVTFVSSKGGHAVVNQQDDEGWAPLHSAVSCGHEAVTEHLLKLGANINVTNAGGQTPLHYAASKGRTNLLRLLLKHGADVNRQDATGSTALHRAASAAKVESVRVLVDEGSAKLNIQDKTGATPLFIAVSCGQPSIAMYLASKGANLEVETKEKETALSIAKKDLRDNLLKANEVAMDED